MPNDASASSIRREPGAALVAALCAPMRLLRHISWSICILSYPCSFSLVLLYSLALGLNFGLARVKVEDCFERGWFGQ